MDDAIRLLKTRQMKGLPNEAPPIGVVHASAEIALESARLQDSLLTEKANFNLAQYTALGSAGDLVGGGFVPRA